ncbi:L domain-like protein [Coniochaeta ligniaria NRRL 30616]|uniref:L domain-like protein n=1 Tax=Coniochaeta ligniaria NRRL 30616 TaxID=1408157 RepID=A0A1J7INS4_9PEZI|nr:L domain-like protein [Coniochaeta ligniaria NRRL 30616]
MQTLNVSNEQELEALQRGDYRLAGIKNLNLNLPLYSFPAEILPLGDLEMLDLSASGLSSLPEEFSVCLPKLEILSLSDCAFSIFPASIAACPNLVMVNLNRNGMTTVPEGAIPTSLRWLFLTDNHLRSLPDSIGNCSELTHCRLSANQLRKLPTSMARCRELTLLRLSSNNFSSLPTWLFRLPKLAYLSFAGNPCSSYSPIDYPPCSRNRDWVYLDAPNRKISAANIFINRRELGSSITSVAHEGLFRRPRNHRYNKVVFRVFVGENAQDGTPEDEIAAHLKAGSHHHLICPIAWFRAADLQHWEREDCDETFHGGLVMQRMPPGYRVLTAGRAKQPYPSERHTPRPVKISQLSVEECLGILHSISAVAWHLHNRGVAHGDLVGYNVYHNITQDHTLLVDFGAATIYTSDAVEEVRPCIERIEVLAFGKMLEHVMSLANPWCRWGRVMDPPSGLDGERAELWTFDRRVCAELDRLTTRCLREDVLDRPSFFDIQRELGSLVDGYQSIRDYHLYPMSWTVAH